MNFIFEWQNNILRMNAASKILFLPREKKNVISSSRRVMFFFHYIDMLMTAFLMIFRRFPTILRRFPKIFKNCSEGQTNVPEHFPRISENARRCPKIAEDFRGRPEDVSMIHHRI